MRPSTLLLCLSATLGLASPVSDVDSIEHTLQKRTCFATGEKLDGQRKQAYEMARTACRGPLKGTYNKREVRVKCYNLANNKHIKLSLGLTGHNAGSSRNIGEAE